MQISDIMFYMQELTQQLIIKSIDEVRADTKAILQKLHDQDKEIDRLKYKSGFWGILGGALSVFGVKIGSLFNLN